jgi:hypothetical protein
MRKLKVRERYSVPQIQSRRDGLAGPLTPTARFSGLNLRLFSLLFSFYFRIDSRWTPVCAPGLPRLPCALRARGAPALDRRCPVVPGLHRRPLAAMRRPREEQYAIKLQSLNKIGLVVASASFADKNGAQSIEQWALPSGGARPTSLNPWPGANVVGLIQRTTMLK